MRFFCILISIVVVNVLADDKIIEYKRELVYTNRQIKRVSDPNVRLQKVIRQFVRGDTPMVKLSYMFAAPAKAIVPFLGNESNEHHAKILQECINSQNELQKEINNTLGVSVLEKVLGYSTLRNVACGCKSMDFDEYGFVELGAERTNLTRDAVSLLINVVSEPSHEDHGNRYLMCRLKGVYRSIVHPDVFVTLAKVDGEECRLTGIDKNEHAVNFIGSSLI
ncbi:uncharacterized protein LOC126847907 isoform X2 [Adelges cooleyi]|nr:uncharacterized protein LOC126847907 isoform X2 [Adelges cooleyi]XP_050444299.1 uncharacterized protein LOC126847907 isoform X2 [Adelges cooleyi]XP_050444300.1 uncharacterized protein LOC126847907 isoform X2 [Adelges cooleyi]XP_050444301.1 uncharacterized protein LOC126847907 isoform X2 [Adelges cooleyi]XP_050444302.1 uncharacterized protein LOC126847907 isoform X2 [Adelges cooleyi]XP_050444304.1 uncharacterized protein LOC126847907 isoform X2 [Adelges cooleyi]XP_050444305.1 uncharacterize